MNFTTVTTTQKPPALLELITRGTPANIKQGYKENSTPNVNRIISFEQNDCQNANVDVNTEFQHPDDGYSDDSDDYSWSSTIVDIPMSDMNLQIEASGEDGIAHHTKLKTKP